MLAGAVIAALVAGLLCHPNDLRDLLVAWQLPAKLRKRLLARES